MSVEIRGWRRPEARGRLVLLGLCAAAALLAAGWALLVRGSLGGLAETLSRLGR